MDKLDFVVVGYGAMGKLVEKALKKSDENVRRIIDPALDGLGWTDASLKGVNSAICFTTPDAGYETTKRILKEGVDAVVATTRFYLNADGTENKDMLGEFDFMAKESGSRMMYASNFSIGMNAFWKHLKPMAETMAKAGYDVAVEERHHSRKADVAGTAKTIGNILLRAYENKEKLNLGDCERKREAGEVTVSSTRVGYIPGTHTVIFDSPVDSIEFTHIVRDPKIFANGAIDAAYWLREQEPGVYSIRDRL